MDKINIPREELDRTSIEVLHIQVDDMIGEREAHFHVVAGIRNGRPYVEVTSIGKKSFEEKRKRVVAPWKEKSR